MMSRSPFQRIDFMFGWGTPSLGAPRAGTATLRVAVLETLLGEGKGGSPNTGTAVAPRTIKKSLREVYSIAVKAENLLVITQILDSFAPKRKILLSKKAE